jgi:hypothetical protein
MDFINIIKSLHASAEYIFAKANLYQSTGRYNPGDSHLYNLTENQQEFP